MKRIILLCAHVLTLGTILAEAQQTPKLAIIGVEPVPSLLKKFGAPTEDAQSVPGIPGVWRGRYGNNIPISLILTKAPDGSLHGQFNNLNDHRTYNSEAVMVNGA